jgi:hypothetical protein
MTIQKRVNMTKTYTATVEEHEETGELFFQLPEYALNQMGWYEGDLLEWLDNGDGSWTITKKEHDAGTNQ